VTTTASDLVGDRTWPGHRQRLTTTGKLLMVQAISISAVIPSYIAVT
jgi:hypothetical protein